MVRTDCAVMGDLMTLVE